MIDHDLTETLRTGIEQHFAAWMWADVVLPLLVRPAWLVPASLGLICAGAAFSVAAASRRVARTGAANGITIP